MLRSLHVNNYKTLVNFDLEFQPLTLISGDNGSGKTTVLEVLSFLRKFVVTGQPLSSKLAKTRTRWESNPFQAFVIVLQDGETEFTYELRLKHDADREHPRIHREILRCRTGLLFEAQLDQQGEYSTQLYSDDHSKARPVLGDWNSSGLCRIQPRRDNVKLQRFLTLVQKIHTISINPWRMLSESRGEEEEPDETLENFVSWYRHSIQEKPGESRAFQADIKDVIPHLRDLFLSKEGKTAYCLWARFGTQDSIFELSLDELSEGQRALLGLYAAIHWLLADNSTVILDEPDNFVSLLEIEPWLRAVRDRTEEGAQAILISHHPRLLDALAAEAGIILSRPDGYNTEQQCWVLDPELPLAPSELHARGLHVKP